MERNYEFKIGQAVKTLDEDSGLMVRGVVVDKTVEKVYIKWEDLKDPCEHERSEFYKIHLA